MTQDQSSIAELNRVFALQKSAYQSDPNPSADIRRDRLHRLADVVLRNRQQIVDAMVEDFGAHPRQFAELVEVSGVAGRAAMAMESLDAWMTDDLRPTDPNMVGEGRAFIRHQPKGVIGNMVPWNFPFDLGLGPVTEMFAAGNRVIIKPSEFTPACSAVMQEMISSAFAHDEAAVVVGGLELAKSFAGLRWDHLLYTGSPTIGREILKAAAPNLVPVTLELGGKCPVVLTEDAVTPQDVASLIGGKLIKSGQMCVTADYVLLPEDCLGSFVEHAKAFFEANLEAYTGSTNCTGIINKARVARLQSLVDEAQKAGVATVELGGAPQSDSRQLPLTLLINPARSLNVMREEIFGPVLPIITYREIDEAIAFINEGEKPLGLYIYSHTQADIDAVIDRTASGGVCVNGVGFQAALPNLGFGGVGESGNGRHHGVEGFREFSNPRGIMARAGDDMIDAMNPPYGEVADMMVAGAREALEPLKRA